MKTRTGFSLAVLATAILLLCQMIAPAVAQDEGPPPEPPSAAADQPGPDQAYPDQGQPDQDPPTRAGRISYTEGSVSFQPGGQGDWVSAVPNRPLTTGDNLWVDKDSRAEIQIGGTSIRLGPETSVTFLDLGDNVTQLRLSLGSLYFRVRHFGSDDNFEVDTPNLAFNVSQPGEFRLDVNQNGDQTIATVRQGSGEVTGAGNSYRLDAGQQGTFSGTDQLTYDVSDIPSPDDFGRWCLSRDEREDRAQSRQYVSDDMTGYEDLDDYGRWQSTPDYGNVWVPTGVPVGWAPYRFGHWAYVYPWGWTWVEDEPWGFAPFHYGRWAFYSNNWCWVPGPVVVRPVYAPALVAFVGGFSIGVGTAPVGWFPLGPREVYVPWYRTSPRYVENVNITNTRVTVVQVTNVYNNYRENRVTNITYVNRRVNNSVTVVDRNTFVNARPVNRNIVRVDARAMQSARVTPAVVNRFQPARQSVVGVARPVQYHPPEQALRRPVVATRQPVVYRPAAAPKFARPAAPPPVRTVHAAPPTQAQPLQRGARGGPPNRGGPPANAGANRPNQPNAPNRGYVPRPGAPAQQPNAPENRGAAPRPGAPQNNPEANRPGAENNVRRPAANPNYNTGRQNENVPRPGAPETRPTQPENRPGAPENRPAPPENRQAPPENRPASPEMNRNVPRPPSATPQEQPRQYPGTRPENNRPEQNPQARPEQPNRPQEFPQQQNRQQQVPQQQNRPQEFPQQQNRPPETPQTRPEEPARTPPNRQEPPRPESRPQPPPQSYERNNPRPEARPAAPPPREARPAPQREERAPRPEKPPKEDKREPGKGR